jgi:putative secretion ATPase (PEP-CTERM system associated)
MYKEFFGLQEMPFNLTPDPRFLYMSRRHREALAALIYGVREGKGFIVLTGEIGAGKTTLCRAFLRELDPQTTHVAMILNSFLDDLELLQAINSELGIASEAATKRQLIDTLNGFLLEEDLKGKTTVLIIDEAQNLSATVLEQIRMLSNLETETTKLLQVILVGQPELNDILCLPNLEQLNQRITVRCHITPITREEIHHYVRHRLHVAGAKVNISLTAQALNRIYHFSRGIPRKINLICDRALLAAYVTGTFQIDAQIVAKASHEMGRLAPSVPMHRRLTRPMPALALLGAVACAAVVVALVFGGYTSFTSFAPLARFARFKAALAGPVRGTSASPPAPVVALPATTPPPTPPPTPAAPGLDALPDPATVARVEDWTTDADGTVRVADPDLARMASLLTDAALWQRPFNDLEAFRTVDKTRLLGVNLLQVFRKPLVDLCSFEQPNGLRGLLRLDLPLVLGVADPTGRLAPAVLLTRLDGEVCTLADPRLGSVRLGLAALEPLVQRITVVYQDPLDLAALVPGQEDNAVEQVQVVLAREGFWTGGARSKVFDENTTKSLRRFQNSLGFERTGLLDGPTAAAIAARRLTFYPHLTPNGRAPAASPAARPAGAAQAQAPPTTATASAEAQGQ